MTGWQVQGHVTSNGRRHWFVRCRSGKPAANIWPWYQASAWFDHWPTDAECRQVLAEFLVELPGV